MRTIIAQSGAGKTTYCKMHRWLKDGDTLSEIQDVYDAMRSRYGEDWVTTNFDKARGSYTALMLAAKRKLDRKVDWMAISNTMFADTSSVFVIPLKGVVRRQLSKPRDGHSFQHDKHRASWADSDRSTYIQAARRLKCLVFLSFDDLDTVQVGQSVK